MPYQQIFVECKSSWETDIVKIELVPYEVIHSLNQSTQFGFTEAKGNGNAFTYIKIFIDEQYDWEIKLRTLFHEYGHAVHYLDIGMKIGALKKKDDLAWITETEYHAIYRELDFSKQLFSCGHNEFLLNTVNIINERLNNYCKGYSEAIQQLQKESLWIECNRLLNALSGA